LAGQPYPSSPQYPSPSQYPSSSPYPDASPAAPATNPGRLAFILAVVSLGLGLVTTVSYPLIFRWSYDPVVIGAFGTVGNGLVFLVALAGLLLGIVAAKKPGSKILPGIAIGITAAQLAGILISWVSNLFYALPF